MAKYTARKIHKQMYPATYNFKDDEDGAFPSGWTDEDGTDCETTIISSLDGHRKVIQLFDNHAVDLAKASISVTQGLNTEFEFYHTKDSVALNTRTQFWLSEGATRVVDLRWEGDDLDYFDGGAHGIKNNFVVVNTLDHYRIVLDDTANTFSIYINGVLEGAGLGYENNTTSGINKISLVTDSSDIGYKGFFDAIGVSVDTDYNIGDNVHWRHLKESTDTFETDDVGTQGTSITWLDWVSSEDDHEIVAEFNTHKKILRTYQNSGAGDCYHTFASQSTAGWVAGWIKVADANTINGIIKLREEGNDRIWVQIDNDRFEYDAGAGMITAGVAAVDATWYFVYLQWYADNTFDLWVNNVQYLDGVSTFADFIGSGINRWYIDQDTAGAKYIYHNAPISSLDSDVRADNRTFDYLPYTYDDITSDIIMRLEVSFPAYNWSRAVFNSKNTLTLNSLHILQLYNINSILWFEGNYHDLDKRDRFFIYTFYSLNKSEMDKDMSYAASSAEVVDSTFHGLMTNVSQIDGRLNYYTEHNPSGNLTPNIIKTPMKELMRRGAWHGNTYMLTKPNGVCFLDDDRDASYTISSTSGHIASNPDIKTIDTQINKVTVFGAINPDTGLRFSGVSEDTTAQADGTEIVEYTKHFPDLQSDADCASRATAIRTGTGFNPTRIRGILFNVYALIGERVNYAYSPKSFSATDCYVEDVIYNLIKGTGVFVLNTGIFEGPGINEPTHRFSDENVDNITETIYNSDINTIAPHIFGLNGAGFGNTGMQLDAVNEIAAVSFYVDSKVDDSRDMLITFVWFRNDVNNDTIAAKYSLGATKTDGSEVSQWVNPGGGLGDAITLDACIQNAREKYQLTLDAADFDIGDEIVPRLHMNEANRDIDVTTIIIRYFVKRSV